MIAMYPIAESLVEKKFAITPLTDSVVEDPKEITPKKRFKRSSRR